MPQIGAKIHVNLHLLPETYKRLISIRAMMEDGYDYQFKGPKNLGPIVDIAVETLFPIAKAKVERDLLALENQILGIKPETKEP